MQNVKNKIINSKTHSKKTGKDGYNFVGYWLHQFDEFQVKVPCSNNECRVIFRGSEILRLTQDEFRSFMRERQDGLTREFLDG